MNKETMTVHQALSELKVLDARIHKEMRDLNFAVANKHGNAKISGVPVGEFVENAKSRYNSVRTLISRRNAIKRAVTGSNAVTKVTVGDVEYTVAEAIDMKNVGMVYWKTILSQMETQYDLARNLANRENDKLDARADAYIQSLYDGADMKNLSDEIRKARNNFIEAQTVELVDPVNVVREMERLRDAVDKFSVNVDSALSVSNALTAIEVEYETY